MAERLPFGEIRPGARPIGAFIQPAQLNVAGAARPNMLDAPSGVSTIQRASGGNVQGYNQFEQMASALAPFSRQLMELTGEGIVSYAKGKIDDGYYAELKNQQARSALSLQLQQEQGAAQAAGTISQLQKVDPPAAQLLAENNPWKAIGRRRALAQLAAGEIDNVLETDLLMNSGPLSSIQPGSPELMQRKAALSQQALDRYGLQGDELESQYYVVPKLNKAWDDYTAKQRTLYSQQLQISTTATTTAALGQTLQGFAQNGIPFNGRVYMPGDPEFAQLAGGLLTLEIDKSLTMFGGKEKADAVKTIREQLVGTFGQVPMLADALSFVQGGNPGDKVRPTWGASNPLDLLELQNRGNGARVQNYELGQKSVGQQLDGLWWEKGMPGSMLPTDPAYAAALIDFRNKAGAMGYRDIDGYMKGRMDSRESVVSQAYAPDPLASQDFLNTINDLPPSVLSTPEGIQRVREQARQAARNEPTRELQAARYKEYIDAIEAKQKQAEEFTPGVKQDIDRALLQDLGLPAVKGLIDQGKGNQSMFQSLLQSGADPASAASSALGSAAVSAFTTRIQNLYLRNVEAAITDWREKNPGRALTPAAKNVLTSQAIADTRKSKEYSQAYSDLTGKKPGEVGPATVGTGPSQGSKPGPENRGVPRSAAAALPDSTVKGFTVRPVLAGDWLHSELANVSSGKAVSPQLYQLAKRAGTTTNRYLLEQLRFYPQLDPQGEARRYLETQVKQQRYGQTVSSANYQGAMGQRAAAPYNPMAPGSWLMNMLMPPAAAATLPPGYARYGGDSDPGQWASGPAVAASHPEAGSGYTIPGAKDANGRPLILAQGAANSFAAMMRDSGGQVRAGDVASGKRSHSKNSAVGGVSGSEHLHGNAMDIHGSSIAWIRKNGAKYGWYVNDYDGSHGGHVEFRGGGGGGGRSPAALKFDQIPGGQAKLRSLATLARSAGFSRSELPIMVAIAMAESGGRATAHNPNRQTGDNSYGLWQINMIDQMGPERRRQFGITNDSALLDPATNAKAARMVKGSQGFGAWSVYRSGAYKAYLSAAQQVVNQMFGR